MVTQALGIAALLAGLSLLGLALYLYRRQRSFLRRAREATGVVVALSHSPGEGGTLKHPVVEFTTAEGELVEFESPVGQSPPAYRVGQRVLVLYDPARPKSAAIRSFVPLWQWCLVTGLLGATLTCCVGPGALVVGALAPSLPVPASPRSAEERRAMELARQYLERERLRWGEPVEITPQPEPGTFWLAYPTPPEELKVLGDRALTVDVRSGEVKVVPRL
jgi:Protein of unknown function (DUF3592)